MQDCKTAYSLSWQDGGSWNGYTFVRKATMPNIDGEITFKAVSYTHLDVYKRQGWQM